MKRTVSVWLDDVSMQIVAEHERYGSPTVSDLLNRAVKLYVTMTPGALPSVEALVSFPARLDDLERRVEKLVNDQKLHDENVRKHNADGGTSGV